MTGDMIYDLYLPYPGMDDRLVRVYVPAHKAGETLPVIYMTDGQNLFEPERSAFGCWQTREAVAAEREQSGKSAIIVGIHNDLGPMIRTNELTPKSIGAINCPPEFESQFDPSGEVFDRFVTDVVMPAVEDRFPARKGRAYTAFCGSSSGGLQAFFTAMSHPDLFGAAGVFSPALMIYAPDDLERWMASMIRDEMPYLYFYCGGEGEMEAVMCRCMETVYDALLEIYPPDSMCEVILPDQPHHESAWANVFCDFLHTFLHINQDNH